MGEFFAGLRAGRGKIHGEHGSLGKLTRDIYRFAGCILEERPWMAPLLPLTALIPLFTGSHWISEIRFCNKWAPELLGVKRQPRMLWDVDSRLEANWAR